MRWWIRSQVQTVEKERENEKERILPSNVKREVKKDVKLTI